MGLFGVFGGMFCTEAPPLLGEVADMSRSDLPPARIKRADNKILISKGKLKRRHKICLLLISPNGFPFPALPLNFSLIAFFNPPSRVLMEKKE